MGKLEGNVALVTGARHRQGCLASPSPLTARILCSRVAFNRVTPFAHGGYNVHLDQAGGSPVAVAAAFS